MWRTPQSHQDYWLMFKSHHEELDYKIEMLTWHYLLKDEDPKNSFYGTKQEKETLKWYVDDHFRSTAPRENEGDKKKK